MSQNGIQRFVFVSVRNYPVGDASETTVSQISSACFLCRFDNNIGRTQKYVQYGPGNSNLLEMLLLIRAVCLLVVGEWHNMCVI